MNTREIAAEFRLGHWAQVIHERAEKGLASIRTVRASEFTRTPIFTGSASFARRRVREYQRRQSNPEQMSFNFSCILCAFPSSRDDRRVT